MKKLFLLILLIPFVVGCTIELKNNNDDDYNIPTDNEEETVKNEGVKSSLSSPLEIGKCGLASKYDAKTGEYVTVDVTLNKEETSNYISTYNKEHPDDKFTTSNGYRAYVLKYEVKLTNFETENFGVEPTLDVEIVDAKGKEFVVSKVKQVIEVKVLHQDLGVVKNNSGQVIIAFNIPNNYDSIIVKLGTKGKKQAYFKL